jgi:hypothetical protein
MASAPRPRTDTPEPEEAEVLRRFIEAVESGELMESAPQDDAVVRLLQGTLTALESVPSGSRGTTSDW